MLQFQFSHKMLFYYFACVFLSSTSISDNILTVKNVSLKICFIQMWIFHNLIIQNCMIITTYKQSGCSGTIFCICPCTYYGANSSSECIHHYKSICFLLDGINHTDFKLTSALLIHKTFSKCISIIREQY